MLKPQMEDACVQERRGDDPVARSPSATGRAAEPAVRRRTLPPPLTPIDPPPAISARNAATQIAISA